MFSKTGTGFLFFLLMSIPVCGQDKTDSIFMFNGNILRGDIKGAQIGELTLDADGLTIMQIKQYRIKSMHSKFRFKVQTSDKQTHTGRLRISRKPGWVDVIRDEGDTLSLLITDLHSIVALQKQFFRRLDGNLSAGFSFAKSSTIGQLTFSGAARYSSEEFMYGMTGSLIASLDSGSFSRDREDFNLYFYYNFKTTSWFLSSGLNYQRNLELSIARRYQELIGGGNKFVSGEHVQLYAMSGISFNQEKSTTGETKNLLLEIPFIFRFDFFKYHNPNMQISSSNSIFFSLTEEGRFRFDGRMTFSWEVAKRFYWTINPYANSDNQSPGGTSSFDFGVAVGLSWKF